MNTSKRRALEVEILDFLSRFKDGLELPAVAKAFPHTRCVDVLEHLERRGQVRVYPGGFYGIDDAGWSRLNGAPALARTV